MTTRRIPIETDQKDLEEGFYQQIVRGNIFYLSGKDDTWYVQFFWHETPLLIQPTFPTIYAHKVDPLEALRELEKEKRFVESKLASLAAREAPKKPQ